MRSFTAPPKALKLAFISTVLSFALGDPNDWVSIEYVVAKGQLGARGGRSATSDAEMTIARNADSSASKGPWSIVNSEDTIPPSQDPHDFMSWAPYHWPNCNWCSAGQTRLVHTEDSSKNDTYGGGSGGGPPFTSNALDSGSSIDIQAQLFMSLPDFNFRRHQVTNSPIMPSASIISSITYLPGTTPLVSSVLLTATSAGAHSAAGPARTETPNRGTRGPAQAAAKTKSSCTPSPTKSLAPRATWTTCPYVVRDGQVNPDVRILQGPDAINSVSQAVMFNAVSYALKKTPSYSQITTNFIDAFFLTESTKMNPNLNFAQIVRGPGPEGRSGTFTGVLDLRGIVKIVNGISILKAAGSPDWTTDRNAAMSAWLSDYSNWLVNSDIGSKAASRPNNHGSFYVSQLAATKILAGDKQGAMVVVRNFFGSQFLDQLAASGEQPFEAVRTRPYHYRCFNLEALITNAKLGDHLGMNLWTAKSKYGGTIQTALDFLIKQDPKDEDPGQVFPHVAAIAAAYGDPQGKYAAFLTKHEPNYRSKSYWFYDQPSALPNGPASSSKIHARSDIWRREDSLVLDDGRSPVSELIDFECPSVFDTIDRVEIDDGIYATCEELRPFYDAVPGTLDSEMPR